MAACRSCPTSPLPWLAADEILLPRRGLNRRQAVAAIGTACAFAPGAASATPETARKLLGELVRAAPKAGRVKIEAEVHLRLRLAESQNVIVVAELCDGSAWTATREVKVTVGGCST